jgi:hypothetical protein
VSDLKYFPRKQKAPEYPLRLEADRQSAIQWENYRARFINKMLKNFMTGESPMQKIANLNIYVGTKEEYRTAASQGMKIVCALNRANGFVTRQYRVCRK